MYKARGTRPLTNWGPVLWNRDRVCLANFKLSQWSLETEAIQSEPVSNPHQYARINWSNKYQPKASNKTWKFLTMSSISISITYYHHDICIKSFNFPAQAATNGQNTLVRFSWKSVFLRQSSMRPSPLGKNGAKQPKAIIWPQLIQRRGWFRMSETPQPTTLHHRWWYPQRYILLKERTAKESVSTGFVQWMG